jgi:hypothetical protein
MGVNVGIFIDIIEIIMIILGFCFYCACTIGFCWIVIQGMRNKL